MAADTEGGLRPGTPELRRVSVALFLAGVATFAAVWATQPLLPTLSAEFGVTPAQAALSVSGPTLALGLGLLVAGPLSDTRGRTWLVHGSLGLSGLLGLACAAAWSWESLLALRTLQGLALAGLPAVATAYLREEVHRDAAAGVIGLYVGGTALGGMSGRLLAAPLAEWAGWRAAIAGVAVLVLLCALLVRWSLPPSQRFRPAPGRPRAVAAQLARQLRDPVLVGLFACGGLLMGAFVAVFNGLAFRLESPEFGLSTGVAGLVFATYALGSVASALAGRVSSRVGPRPVAPVAVAVAVGGILLTLAAPLGLVVTGTAVMVVGFFAAHGVASGWVTARASLGVGGAGQAASLYLLAYYAGASGAGAAAGAAWARSGWPGVVVLASTLMGTALVVTVVLARTRRLRVTPAPVPEP
ncbi:MFS transporter [Aquipuribacter nitratireducens]|uniref:MFS transporter n=1 Tax=Aquipuribacter nitratireducens TaxID=650104 RepID=A0ABW0GTP4_9MICO